MSLSLCIEKNNGYIDMIRNVKKVFIEKENRISYLIYKTITNEEIKIKLSDIRLAYLFYIDNDNVEEVFRYEK